MSFEHLSTNQPGLFAEPDSPDPSPAPRVRPPAAPTARRGGSKASPHRDLSHRPGRRNDDERAFVERLYDEAMAEGPDFINYRAKSAFLAAPKLGIDRNAYARILNALEAISGAPTRAAARRASRASRAPWRRCSRPFSTCSAPAVRRRYPFPRRHRAPGLRLQADRGQLPQALVALRLRHRSPAHQAHPHGARLQGGAGHQRLHDPGTPGARRNRPAHV